MSTLTIDTSTVSVIALVGEKTIVRRSPDSRHHAETLVPLVEEIVTEAGETPDLIVAGTGPAAFTGLRAGLVTARVLARSWNIPIVGIGSLEIIGRAALDHAPGVGRDVHGDADTPQTDNATDALHDPAPVIAVGDARRKEVYAAEIAPMGNDDVTVTWGPEVLSPQALADKYPGARFVGPGAELYSDILPGGLDQVIEPVVMERLAKARLARVDAGEELDLGTEPKYLRRPDIHGA
ncbi:tRNA (adenosine(37)-N6)-threonylcarbamoyltransferase complex dimerization subunit type 1 TsaB [Flaviflexus sp.]|uniref:tRNA (adenosine(37)-N6)-threonylcarbamoyltransferase complex dimerization subunit type 1 TsaB n=1 Tax=Flaviflexus sp. TaxID=1969482 RepID=UPI003F90672D